MDKRKIDIISVCSIIAILVISYFVFLKDDISAYKSLRQKHASLKNGISSALYNIDMQRDRDLAIIALEREIRDNGQFLRGENDTPYFLNYISSLARGHKIKIVSIEPGESVVSDSVTRNKFTAVLNGKFPDIYNFLYYLEDEWRAVKVETLVMDKSTEDKNVNATITLLVLSLEGYKEKV